MNIHKIWLPTTKKSDSEKFEKIFSLLVKNQKKSIFQKVFPDHLKVFLWSSKVPRTSFKPWKLSFYINIQKKNKVYFLYISYIFPIYFIIYIWKLSCHCPLDGKWKMQNLISTFSTHVDSGAIPRVADRSVSSS